MGVDFTVFKAFGYVISNLNFHKAFNSKKEKYAFLDDLEEAGLTLNSQDCYVGNNYGDIIITLTKKELFSEKVGGSGAGGSTTELDIPDSKIELAEEVENDIDQLLDPILKKHSVKLDFIFGYYKYSYFW
jgi:hypothetical protein